jgi:signal peptidase I
MSDINEIQPTHEPAAYDLHEDNAGIVSIEQSSDFKDHTSSVRSALLGHQKKDNFWMKIIIFMLVIIVLRLFVIDPFLVNGSSMEPTFEDGDYVIVDKLSYHLHAPGRGDVIVFDAPTNDGRYFIKRVIGLPGERIVVDGLSTTIYNTENPNGFAASETYVRFPSNRRTDTTLKSDEYFVMGDNREVSSDSRIWGPLKTSAIEGRAVLRLLPFKDFGVMPGSIGKFADTKLPK